MDASSDAARGPRLRGQLLLLRGRAGLSQRALAAQLGISEHAIAHWEAGRGYPSAARLQALIALYLERGVFTAGREAAEAMALWALLRREAAQRTPPFDAARSCDAPARNVNRINKDGLDGFRTVQAHRSFGPRQDTCAG